MKVSSPASRASRAPQASKSSHAPTKVSKNVKLSEHQIIEREENVMDPNAYI